MKKLLVVLMVLSMATIANAGLQMTVDSALGTTEIVAPAVVSVGLNGADYSEPVALAIWYITTGGAALDASTATLWLDSVATNLDVAEYGPALVEFGWTDVTSIVSVEVKDLTEPYSIPNGALISGMTLTATGAGTLNLVDMDTLSAVETVIVTPEPMTMGLLGLGGLFLRRRK